MVCFFYVLQSHIVIYHQRFVNLIMHPALVIAIWLCCFDKTTLSKRRVSAVDQKPRTEIKSRFDYRSSTLFFIRQISPLNIKAHSMKDYFAENLKSLTT